jgi:transcriptional regulator GlxA family with amidase domain
VTAPNVVGQWQNGHMPHESRHRVAVLALEEVVAFDLTTVTQTFGHPDECEHYLLEVCAVTPGPIATHTGFSLLVPYGLEAVARADTIFVPGFVGEVPEPARAALSAAADRGARMVSICTGAFALAASGILDNRLVTTHWNDAAALATRYPRVQVDADALFIDEGQVLTSAGVSAGIDLCLYLIQRDLGVAEAHRIADESSLPRNETAARPNSSSARSMPKLVTLPRPARGCSNTSTRGSSRSRPWPDTRTTASAPSPGAFGAKPASRRCGGYTSSEYLRRADCSRRPI